jgi:hypothetical protein
MTAGQRAYSLGAFGGIRTPNLLIRRPNFGVREGVRWSPLIASELRVRVERWSADSGVYRANRYISDTSTMVDARLRPAGQRAIQPSDVHQRAYFSEIGEELLDGDTRF